MARDIPTRLVYARENPVFGRLAYYLLKLLGVEIPLSVKIGTDFELVHGGFGTVIHPAAVIGNHVKIYQGVTLGRADIHQPMALSAFEGINVEDNAIISPGAKILCKEGLLRIAEGSIIGANAVLTQSTRKNEIWAGVPARKIGIRESV